MLRTGAAGATRLGCHGSVVSNYDGACQGKIVEMGCVYFPWAVEVHGIKV